MHHPAPAWPRCGWCASHTWQISLGPRSTSFILCPLSSCGPRGEVRSDGWRQLPERLGVGGAGRNMPLGRGLTLWRGSTPTVCLSWSQARCLPGLSQDVAPGAVGVPPLPGVMSVLRRVSFLKKAVDQRNKALTSLNEAMNVSCALLSSGTGPRPISCTTSTTWSRLQTQDVLMATCVLENSSSFSLDQGWTLCIQVLTSSCALDLDSACSAITYTIPVDQLGPGARREVTLPLGPGENGGLDLPVTVSCTLFYSLREVVGGALAPSDSEDPFLDECPSDVLPEQEGVCLPLSRHTVDMLQCLRFPGLAPPHTRAPSPLGPTRDPVATFLETCREPGSQPAGPASLRAEYLPPSVASIKVSAELLRAALKDGHSGVPLCCATLQWLLAENAAVDVVRARALSSIQGVAPDGANVHLIVREVAMTDLCPAGPIQAVEIQVESSSLADICRAHHAVVGRMQTMVTEQATQGSSAPDLRVQYLRQIHANHETLLREVQTLRDRLCTEDEASSCATAQRLLQVYRQLRHPSLILL
uniref:FA core complex associated protein 100 n=1 Tax=Homo sapiens TaxID=9606 RepID=E7EVV8_HUMAN